MATLRQLKVFITTAEYKKMSRAAEHLYISQPTISQIISDLEKEYQVTLFERHSKELKITPAGKLLLDNARQIVAIHEILEQNMKAINSLQPLRIGATMTIGIHLMGKLTKEMNELYPNIETFVSVTNTRKILEMLLHNELDIALVEGVITHEEIITKPIFVDNLCIICSSEHPLATKKTIVVEDLHNQNFLLREKGSGTRAIFEKLMLVHHVPYKVTWESSSTPAIIDGVEKNLGLGFVSERCISEHVTKGSIHACPAPDINLKRFFYLCYNKSHPITPQMQNFISYINTLPPDYH